MRSYLDIADEWERNQKRPRSIDGHVVKDILWETDRMIIFRDPDGRIWRRVHSWGMTWPLDVQDTVR